MVASLATVYKIWIKIYVKCLRLLLMQAQGTEENSVKKYFSGHLGMKHFSHSQARKREFFKLGLTCVTAVEMRAILTLES